MDRLKLSDEARKRLAESVETALEIAEGTVIALREPIGAAGNAGAGDEGHRAPGRPSLISRSSSRRKAPVPSAESPCPRWSPGSSPSTRRRELVPYAPAWAKLEFDPDLVIPDGSLSFNEGGCIPYNPDAAWNRSRFEALAKHFKFSLETAFDELPKKVLDAILYGTDEAVKVKYENREGTGRFEYESRFPGILADLKRRYLETQSEGIKQWLERFMSETPCDAVRRQAPPARGPRGNGRRHRHQRPLPRNRSRKPSLSSPRSR